MRSSKVLDVLSLAGSAASLVSLLFIKGDWSIAKSILLLSILIVFVISVYVSVIKRDTKVYHTQKEINNFMKKWVKIKGVVKILSRDLSWVNDEIIESFAKKGADLHLYVMSENRVVKKIREKNPYCKIYFYGEYGFEPDSRYTIIRANRDSRQIAITLKEQNSYTRLHHEIYISKGNAYDKKMLGLANDLMKCMECVDQEYGEKDS